jgi:DNA replication protein DnaC
VKRQILHSVFWTKPLPCDCTQAQIDQQEYAEHEEMVRAQEEIQRQQRLYTLLLERSRLPRRYYDARFDTAARTDNNRGVYESVIDYCTRFAAGDTSQGLFITGSVETGKTHLAACIANDLMSQGTRVTFGSVYSLLGRIRSTYDGGSETEDQILDELTRSPLLILDDLGKEKVSAFVQRVLFQVIDERYNHMRGIVVTSNWTLTALEERYDEVGPAIVSRLSEMCAGIMVAGDSWRRRI